MAGERGHAPIRQACEMPARRVRCTGERRSTGREVRDPTVSGPHRRNRPSPPVPEARVPDPAVFPGAADPLLEADGIATWPSYYAEPRRSERPTRTGPGGCGVQPEMALAAMRSASDGPSLTDAARAFDRPANWRRGRRACLTSARALRERPGWPATGCWYQARARWPGCPRAERGRAARSGWPALGHAANRPPRVALLESWAASTASSAHLAAAPITARTRLVTHRRPDVR